MYTTLKFRICYSNLRHLSVQAYNCTSTAAAGDHNSCYFLSKCYTTMSAGHLYDNKRHHFGCKRDPIGAKDKKSAFVIEPPTGYSYGGSSSEDYMGYGKPLSKRKHPSPKHTVMPGSTPGPDNDAAYDEADPSRYPSPQLPIPSSQRFPWLPPSVDLSEWVARVHNQSYNNSCTANAVCAAYGIQLMRLNNNFDPSYMFLWYNTRKLSGDEDENEGTSIYYTYEAFRKKGVCEESLWPCSEGLDKIPGRSVYAAAMVNSIEAEWYNIIEKGDDFIYRIEHCLYLGNPVVFHFKVHESFINRKKWGNDFVMPTPDVPIEDALHAVVAVGYDRSTKHVKILNSWGTGSWGGDNGYFYISYDIIESAICGNFWEAPRPTQHDNA